MSSRLDATTVFWICRLLLHASTERVSRRTGLIHDDEVHRLSDPCLQVELHPFEERLLPIEHRKLALLAIRAFHADSGVQTWHTVASLSWLWKKTLAILIYPPCGTLDVIREPPISLSLNGGSEIAVRIWPSCATVTYLLPCRGASVPECGVDNCEFVGKKRNENSQN